MKRNILRFLALMMSVLCLLPLVGCEKTVEPEGDVGPFHIWVFEHTCECTPLLSLTSRLPYFPYDTFFSVKLETLTYVDPSAEATRFLSLEGTNITLNYVESEKLLFNDLSDDVFEASDVYQSAEYQNENWSGVACRICYVSGTDQPYSMIAYLPMPTMKSKEDCKNEAIRLLSTYMGVDVSSYAYSITTYFDDDDPQNSSDTFKPERGNEGAISRYRYQIEFFNPVAEDAPFETIERYEVTWNANMARPSIEVRAHRSDAVSETTEKIYQNFEQCENEIYTYLEELLAELHEGYSNIRVTANAEEGKHFLFIADGKVWIICNIVGTFMYEDGERGEQEMKIALSYDLPTDETS